MMQLKPKPKKNIEKKQINIINISLKVKSIGIFFWFFKFKPNTILYQHLLNPINPKKFAEYNKKIVEIGAVLINPENI